MTAKTETKREALEEMAQAYTALDDMHKGMLLGWAAALKMMAGSDDDGKKSA